MHIDTLQAGNPASMTTPAPSLPQSTRGVIDHGGKPVVAAPGKNLPQGEPATLDVHVATELIDRFLREAGRALTFSVDEASGRTIVSVRDPATGKLIRQVPSEEVLRIAANLDLVSAALISEQA